MLPAGFLGTRGDILMDLVVLSFLFILPMLVVSWRSARRADYSRHRAIQLSLASILVVAVGLFEIDLKLSGGIFELTKQSGYAGSGLLNSLIYGHMMVAIGSAVVWVPLVVVSLRKFPNPPASNAFGSTHRVWGRTGMLLMMASGLSAIPLYYFGFAV
jgi:putative membrane protein